MKYRIVRLIIPLFAGVLFSCGNNQQSDLFDPDSDNIQLVLFHLETSCASCDAVKNETLAVMENSFPEEVNAGEIRFVAMNFSDKGGREAAELLRATGQSFYIVKGETVVNLTSDAFMFANTHPQRFRDTLKNEIQKLR
ncbi:MAG: nitrophenyl compound nitroreductase subunit ArsF family protein [Bacteroidales bacterium]